MENTYKENPHIVQATQYPQYPQTQTITPQRLLHSDANRERYRRRNKDIKTVLHWGQRKLLMSEIEFLTEFSSLGDTVVYAGAAPGNHTYFLSLLFPTVKFILVDPNPFYTVSTDRITIIQEYFTDKLAEKLSTIPNLLFISDIRTASWKDMKSEDIEDAVAADMESQQRWHLIMNPKKSILKFRLPWAKGLTEYLEGDLHLPVWGPCSTTEGRLVTSSKKKVLWDNTKYEEQMFYFNTQTRTRYYQHPVKVDGLDHCYDCASEVKIWEDYLRKYSEIWKHAAVKMKAIFKLRKEEVNVPDTESEDTEDTDDNGPEKKLHIVPSHKEKELMRTSEPWELANWEAMSNTVSNKVSITTIEEAITLTNSMCSKGRTLVTKLVPVEKRNWYISKVKA